MTDDQALGQRLQTLIDEAGMTQTALGQLIGVRQGYINQIFRGHKRISATAIFAIAKRFTNLNLHWLLRGEGEMWMPENRYPPPPNPDICTQVQESPANYVPEPDFVMDVEGILRNHEKRLRALEQKK